MNVEMFHDQHLQSNEELSLSSKLYSSHCGTSLHQAPMFHFTVSFFWVVFKIYFAILHKIVAINNVQQSIRLNKQKDKIKVFTLLHYIRFSHVTHPGHLL